MNKIDKAIGSDFGSVSVLEGGHESAHDRAVWRAQWLLEKYHDVDTDEILAPDAETMDILDGVVTHKRDSLVCELERVYLRRGEVRKARRLKGLSAEEVVRKFKTKPDEVVRHLGNLLVYGGVSCLWQCLIGNGTTTAGQTLTYFSNAQAAVGTGDSSTAAAATQTDLQAATNKLRKAMDATYPTHTDATTSGAATITYKSTFGTSEGNYAWAEVAIFNSATAATGRMLNRLVQSFGTKATGSWSMSLAVSIA